MKCLGDKKKMGFKKYLPYIISGVVGLSAGYLSSKIPTNKSVKEVIKEKVEEISSATINESEVTEAEVSFCKPKIVYRTKVIELPVFKKPRVGCNIDWENKEVYLYAPVGYKIKCEVNYRTREFRESIKPPHSNSRKAAKLPLRR